MMFSSKDFLMIMDIEVIKPRSLDGMPVQFPKICSYLVDNKMTTSSDVVILLFKSGWRHSLPFRRTLRSLTTKPQPLTRSAQEYSHQYCAAYACGSYTKMGSVEGPEGSSIKLRAVILIPPTINRKARAIYICTCSRQNLLGLHSPNCH